MTTWLNGEIRELGKKDELLVEKIRERRDFLVKRIDVALRKHLDGFGTGIVSHIPVYSLYSGNSAKASGTVYSSFLNSKSVNSWDKYQLKTLNDMALVNESLYRTLLAD